MSPGGDADLAAIEARPRLAVAPDLVLRQLDPARSARTGNGSPRCSGRSTT